MYVHIAPAACARGAQSKRRRAAGRVADSAVLIYIYLHIYIYIYIYIYICIYIYIYIYISYIRVFVCVSIRIEWVLYLLTAASTWR